jgi:hypothetical protein
MNVLLYKQIEHEIRDLDFEIAEIGDEIADADDDADVDAMHERRQLLEHRRAGLQLRILNLIR